MFRETCLQTQVSYWYGQKAAVPPRFHRGFTMRRRSVFKPSLKTRSNVAPCSFKTGWCEWSLLVPVFLSPAPQFQCCWQRGLAAPERPCLWNSRRHHWNWGGGGRVCPRSCLDSFTCALRLSFVNRGWKGHLDPARFWETNSASPPVTLQLWAQIPELELIATNSATLGPDPRVTTSYNQLWNLELQFSNPGPRYN